MQKFNKMAAFLAVTCSISFKMQAKNEVKFLGSAGASLNESIARFSPKAREKNHSNRKTSRCTRNSQFICRCFFFKTIPVCLLRFS